MKTTKVQKYNQLRSQRSIDWGGGGGVNIIFAYEFSGYGDILMSSVKSLAEYEDNLGTNIQEIKRSKVKGQWTWGGELTLLFTWVI